MHYEQTAPIGAHGWAIQQVGPWVLGHWDTPMDEDRVLACRRLYRAARDGHGRFSVFAVYTGPPFDLDLLLGGRTRALVVSLLTELRPSVDAIICPLDGTGLGASIMRAARRAWSMPCRCACPSTSRRASKRACVSRARARSLGACPKT